MRNFRLLGRLTAAVVLLSPLAATAQSTSETYRQLNLFGDVFERVRADYVEEVTDEELIKNAINGMLTALDPHSSYLDPDNYQEMQVQTRGEFGGLGIEVTMENGLVKVVSPFDGTPAARAGIQTGDYITHLDGEAVMGLTLSDAVDKMRGPVDTDIVLTIQRANQEPFDVTLTRAIITIQSVRSRLHDDIGYIRITNFSEQTEAGLLNAIEQLRREAGDKLHGIVLDLRNNPGGLLDQAIAVSDAFLDKGEIVSTRGRHSDQAQRYNAKEGDVIAGMPMVVLINGGSASASEIVAGALQDHHRALLLGTKSFGKGSVQTIIPLPGHGAIRLTTARYYTPSGRSIQALGIDPDLVVEPARIEPIEQPRFRSEAELRGALQNDNGDAAPQSGPNEPAPDESAAPPAPEAVPGAETGQPGEDLSQDYQLLRAVDLLRGLALFNSAQVN